MTPTTATRLNIARRLCQNGDREQTLAAHRKLAQRAPQNPKQVTMTAGYDQVRKPINTDSIGRWKLYDKHLTPLKVALGQTDSQAA